jgi:hypothetical protein
MMALFPPVTLRPDRPPALLQVAIGLLFGQESRHVGRRSQVSGDCAGIGLVRGELRWMWWKWKWGPALTIQPGPLLNAPKSSFVRNDFVGSVDAPAGEPHRRHIVYDAVGKRFFAANGAMNRVDVLSTASATVLTCIDVPGASSVDLSPDGATLWVGSAVKYAFAVSTQNLQVTQRYACWCVCGKRGHRKHCWRFGIQSRTLSRI